MNHRRFRAYIAVVAVAASAPLVAQTATPASIEGDVFLVMQNGDVKPVAGASVALYRYRDPANKTEVCRAALDAQLAYVNAQRVESEWRDTLTLTHPLNRRALQRIQAKLDTAGSLTGEALDRRGQAQQAVLEAFAPEIERTGTGMQAHYRFGPLAPGRYILHSQVEMFLDLHSWVVPVTVAAGEARKLDLDNSLVLRPGAAPEPVMIRALCGVATQ